MSKLEKTLSKEDLLQEFRKGIAKMQQSCEELNEAMAQCAETAKQSVKVMRLLRNGKLYTHPRCMQMEVKPWSGENNE